MKNRFRHSATRLVFTLILCLSFAGVIHGRMPGGQIGVIAPVCDPDAVGSVFAAVLRQVDLKTVGAAAEYRPSLLEDWHEQYWHIQNKLSGAEQLPGLPKQTYNKHALVYQEDKNALGTVLRRTGVLLDDIAGMPHAHDLTLLKADLKTLQSLAGDPSALSPALDEPEWGLYLVACALQRRAAFANPLLDFDEILFVARGNYNGSRAQGLKPTRDSQGQHFTTQYFGFTSIPGGGLYIASDLKSNSSIKIRDALEDSMVEEGRLKGERLVPGAFLSPELSYDGDQILFAYTQNDRQRWEWTEDSVFNIFRVGVDGKGLKQLTDGTWNDFDPTYLPGGRIAFTSERRGGYIRCFRGLKVPNYVLHSMKADGSDIYPLSYFETGEWHPSVNNDGMIVYTRWDYVDRENCLGGNFWIMYPDGRNPRAPHGNYPQPWHTFDRNYSQNAFNRARYKNILRSLADFPLHESRFEQEVSGPGKTPLDDGRLGRPYTQQHIRAIPGSQMYVATAAPHHGQAFGSLVLLNLKVPDDGFMSQVRRITPYVPFPESEQADRRQYPYGTAWPLSEDYYIVNWWENIYLLDVFGNQTLLVENSAVFGGEKNWDMRLVSPIPLKPRTMPPVLPTMTNMGEDAVPGAPPATISVMNVYESYLPFPEGTKIKYLRVLQNILKSNPQMDHPRNVGYHWENTPRIPLGIVPVEEDGSVYFEAPIERELIFQVLDENYMAVQSMRSIAYVHPGEQLSCIGCHEDRHMTPPTTTRAPLALQRPPSVLEPEVSDPVEPVTFYRLVEPVFQTSCIGCHQTEERGPQDMRFEALRPYVFHFSGGMRGNIMLRNTGGSRSIPGRVGAMESRMGRVLLNKTHREAVSEADYRRVVLWLDANAMRLGAFHSEQRQMAGEIVWPLLDTDPKNPQGLEKPRPVGDRPLQGPFGVALRPPVAGIFGNALNPSRGGIVVENRDEYRELPITLEVWAKLENAAAFNILVASDTKQSAEHWELYTYPRTAESRLK